MAPRDSVGGRGVPGRTKRKASVWGRRKRTMSISRNEDVAAQKTDAERRQEEAHDKINQLKFNVLVEEFDLEVEARVSAMRAHAEALAAGLDAALRVEILKLPHKVRTMKMKDFKEIYGGDIGNVIQEDIDTLTQDSSIFISQTSKSLQDIADLTTQPAIAERAKMEVLQKLQSIQEQTLMLMNSLQ
eukprot:TRINITY_DN7176_c0_g1_i1.p1 TRINITY_DN7176_c0_g1~~TRINITY_DN7176_c0_g1_i1.p1  ORF type:complete len:218 (+),score=52.05 TRINITY_DN7176_c0_g1_i1:95-655(+)